MVRLIQIIVIGSICAGIFALLYGNATPVSVTFFGRLIATGSLGGFLLIAFFGGLFVTALGAFIIGVGQSIAIRRATARERRMQHAWQKFSDAQLSMLLDDNERATSLYQELLRTTPEATAAFAPLASIGGIQAEELIPENGSALISFLQGQRAEQANSYVRATELYLSAYEQAKIPALLRCARQAAIRASMLDKARELHNRLAEVTKLNATDIDIEAELAAAELPTAPEERPAKLRELLRRYPDSGLLVAQLAELEEASGSKPDQIALLFGRIARANPSVVNISAFETNLNRLSLERALSVIDQGLKGASPAAQEILTESKLAILLHHRAISSALELWSSLTSNTSIITPRMQKLGAALAVLADRKDAAVESLIACDLQTGVAELRAGDLRSKKVVGLAPQYSTP